MNQKKRDSRRAKSKHASLVRASSSFPPALYEGLDTIAQQKKKPGKARPPNTLCGRGSIFHRTSAVFTPPGRAPSSPSDLNSSSRSCSFPLALPANAGGSSMLRIT
jgi:hypothetical protein